MKRLQIVMLTLTILAVASMSGSFGVEVSGQGSVSTIQVRAPLWSYQTGNGVVSVAISNDGKYVVGGSFDNKVYLFDRDSNVPIWNHSCERTVRSVSMASNGRVAFAGDDPKIYLYDRMSGVLHERIAPTSDVASIFDYPKYVSVSSDGRLVATQFEGRIKKDSNLAAYVGLWDLVTDNIKIVELLHAGEATIYTVGISLDGWMAFSSTYAYDYVLHYTVFASNPLDSPSFNSICETPAPSRCLGTSADAAFIAAGCDNQYVYFLSRQTGVLWRHFTGASVGNLDVSASGNLVAVGSGQLVYLYSKARNQSAPYPNTIPLWNCDIGSAIRSLAVSNDGRRLIVGGIDGAIWYFDTASPNPLWSYQTGGPIRSVDISSDGQFIVVGSEDDRIYFFSSEESLVRASLTDSTILVGSNASIAGAVSPIHIGVSMKICSRISGTTQWNLLGTCITNSSGIFSYAWMAGLAGTFEVMAGWDGDADHEASNSSAILLVVNPNQAPTAPQHLVACTNFTSCVLLSWDFPLSDGGLPIRNYKIYRAIDTGHLAFHASAGNQLLFNDADVLPQHNYRYQVSAENDIGESQPSNAVEVDHTVIPEFAPALVLPLCITVTFVLVIISRKTHVARV